VSVSVCLACPATAVELESVLDIILAKYKWLELNDLDQRQLNKNWAWWNPQCYQSQLWVIAHLIINQHYWLFIITWLFKTPATDVCLLLDSSKCMSLCSSWHHNANDNKHNNLATTTTYLVLVQLLIQFCSSRLLGRDRLLKGRGQSLYVSTEMRIFNKLMNSRHSLNDLHSKLFQPLAWYLSSLHILSLTNFLYL
jgi:hypothetical protein